MALLNINQALNSLPPYRERRFFRKLFRGGLFPLRDCALNSGALAIHGSSSALAKTAAAVTYLVGGRLATLGAADLAALSGTVTADAFNVYVFSVNLAGTTVTRMGLEGTTLAEVQFPDTPEGEAILGFVIINPTGTGDFVGGTTKLDDGTVVPNAVYVNTPFPFNPNLR